jgi:hypothetical protein
VDRAGGIDLGLAGTIGAPLEVTAADAAIEEACLPADIPPRPSCESAPNVHQAPVTVGAVPVSQHLDGDTRRPRREETPVGEYLQIFRARVPEESVAALLEIRPAAIAEAQRLCPELLGAQLVRLDDGIWLDVLTWSRPDGEQRLLARAAEFDAVTRMHDLLADVEAPLRGEIIHTSP